METAQILKVCILDDGRMAVFPDVRKAMFQHVYREASGVYWDNEFGCFLSTPPTNWSFKKWYQQIICAVRGGLGLQLILSSTTEYQAQADGFEEAIKLADYDLYR